VLSWLTAKAARQDKQSASNCTTARLAVLRFHGLQESGWFKGMAQVLQERSFAEEDSEQSVQASNALLTRFHGAVVVGSSTISLTFST